MSVQQLRALGFGRGAIAHRVKRRRLHRVHHGVYAIGHPKLSSRGRLVAAVLAGGPGAAASHRSAAHLLALRRSSRACDDVTTATHRRTPGIDLHRSRLDGRDVTEVDGVTCTTWARTLVDLADVVVAREVERAFDQAQVVGLFDLVELEDVLGRARGRRAVGVLGALLADQATGPAITRSELEERMLALIRAAALPAPRVNHPVSAGGRVLEADFAWPERRLIAETDGAHVHDRRRAFEGDRRRDADLLVAGWRVVRFTWRQVVREPGHVTRTLRALL